jgi:4-hydroxy-tetrahydrodipicolinate synthase
MKTIEHPLTHKQIPEFATGVITPVFTPALEGGRLDPKGFARYCERLAEDPNQTTLFIRCGSGQMYTYTKEETKQVIDIATEIVGARKYTTFGTFGVFRGSVDDRPDPNQFIEESLELSKYAEEKGATGVILVVPWALVPEKGQSMEDMQFDYYEKVARSINIPILLYNPPNVPPEYRLTTAIIERIKHLPNMAGAKISTQELAWFSDLELATEGTDFAMIAGHEGVYLPAMTTGALGAIGQGCNIYAHILRVIFEAFMAGDYERAYEAQKDVILGLRNFDGYGNSTSGLAYLKSHGLEIEPWDKSGDPLRTPEEVARIRKGLDPIIEKYYAPAS